MRRDKIINILKNFKYSDYKKLFENYKDWLVDDKVAQSTGFPNSLDEIAVFVFRDNDSIDFNNIRRNNDLLVVLQIVDSIHSIKDEFIPCTADPYGQKEGIAHLCEQIYRGNVGLHRGIASRYCIRSDFDFGTWINRTDSKGKVIDKNISKNFTSYCGHFGINIHDSANLYNSSLGCVIIPSKNDYQIFRKMLLSAANPNNISVSVINYNDVKDISDLFSDIDFSDDIALNKINDTDENQRS